MKKLFAMLLCLVMVLSLLPSAAFAEAEEAAPAMTEEEMLKLLATDGMLVKRPLIVTETAVLTGFKEAEWEKML